MLNILIDSLNCNPNVGSNAESGFGFVSEAAKRNHVYLISYRDLFLEGGNPLADERLEKLSIHLLKPGVFARLGRQSDYLLRCYFTARRIIGSNKIDVVHTVEPNQYRLIRPLSFLRKVPFVLGPLNGGDAYPPQQFLKDLGNRNFAEYKADTVRRSLPGRIADVVNHELVHGHIAQAGTKIAFRVAKLIVVGTLNCLNNIPASFHAKCRHVPCLGVNTDMFSPGQLICNPETVLLYAGRISPWKGLDIVIRALALISKSCNAVLRVAGTGKGNADDECFEAYCRQLAVKLGIEDRVVFKGQIPRQDLLSEYRQCDIFCMTSLWEPFGMVYLEAMSCGKPVICMKTGGPAEMINPDFGYAILPVRLNQFTDELGQCIKELSLNRKKREEMGLKARHHILENFSWESVGLKMQNVYEEAAG